MTGAVDDDEFAELLDVVERMREKAADLLDTIEGMRTALIKLNRLLAAPDSTPY